MSYYIGIEDLAANALIEIMRGKQDVEKYVTLKELESYGAAVVKCLNQTNQTKALLILSRSATTSMFRNYSDFFIEKITDEGLAIELREGKTVEDLEDKFRTYISCDLIKAYMDLTAVSVLNANNKRKRKNI